MSDDKDLKKAEEFEKRERMAIDAENAKEEQEKKSAAKKNKYKGKNTMSDDKDLKKAEEFEKRERMAIDAENAKEEQEKKSAAKKNKWKIDQETAQAEFDRFCDEWEIDDDKESMNEEERKDFEGHEKRFIEAVKRGRLCLNPDDTLDFTFSRKSVKGETVTIKRLTGAGVMEMDGLTDKHMMKKTYALLASMMGKPRQYIAKIDIIDLKPLQAIMTLSFAG